MNERASSPAHRDQSQTKLALRLIGVSSGYGVPPLASEGSAQAAAALQLADVGVGVRRNRIACTWESALSLDPQHKLERNAALRQLCQQLEKNIETLWQTARAPQRILPVVLCGDHAVAEGTWRGVAQASKTLPGLLWIDAHLDAHTNASTPSGNAHGMPLAALLGCTPNPWNNALAVIDAQRSCVFGARSFEPAEVQLLRTQGVRVFDMEEIRRVGLSAAWAEALALVSHHQQPFGISLDLDALDPLFAHGVNTPAAGGLDSQALIHALRSLAHCPQLLAFEISEYNPFSDENGDTARLVTHLLESLTTPLDDDFRNLEAQYGAHNYAPLPVVLTRGEGVYLWDGTGKRYLDMMSAYSAASFGHGHPRLVAALTQQAQRLNVTSRAYYNDRLPLLLARLSDLFGYEAALPVNTGLEAVETALKAARKWGHKVKGIPPDKAQIIACKGNFHGRSITITGMSSEAQYRDGFGPFPRGFKRIAYGQSAALEAAITPHTAAFLVEPIQGEAGIVLPPAGYLRACAEICRHHHVLLICDEVQTGMGRTGKLLAAWHEGVRPDGVILGKALGGGLLPVSAFLADRQIMSVFNPGDHGSTFGGNALAAAVALEALELLVELDLPARSAQLGAHLLQRLQAIDNPLLHQVRGCGLFAGIELERKYLGAHEVCVKLVENGLLSKDTHGTVIRIAPPLVIDAAQLDEGIDIIVQTLHEMAKTLRLL